MEKKSEKNVFVSNWSLYRSKSILISSSKTSRQILTTDGYNNLSDTIPLGC